MVTVLDYERYPDFDERIRDGRRPLWRREVCEVAATDGQTVLVEWDGDTRTWAGHPQRPHGWYDAVAEAMALLTR